ncbi:MAG: Bug family tripartite tricarboxylate transporter substrate binding protein [Pigmentiphaga sp.]
MSCSAIFAAVLAWNGDGMAWAAGDAAYPTRAVRLLIGQAPGGAVDTVARMTAEGLAARLGQPVVVESRPGAGGMLAAGSVARAEPDGYTLGFLDVGALAVAPLLQQSVPYDPERDFSFLGTTARIPLVMVAHPSLEASTPAELTRDSQAKPDELNYASAGVGSPPHLAFEAYKYAAQAPIRHIAYRGGAPALADVVAGHVQLTFIDTNLGSQYVREGRVKAIGVATRNRSPLMPNVPTFAESGIPDFDFAPWVGVVGPAGLPATVVDRVSMALSELVADPGFVERVQALGFEPFPGDAKAFAALASRERDDYRTLIREQQITLGE